MTLLSYALVGLLSLLVISTFLDAWGPITDRLGGLITHPQSSSCALSSSGELDSRCFQRFEPRQFRFIELWMLPVAVLGAYIIGFIPASLAGLLIGARRLSNGSVGFSYAVMIGTLIGLVTGVMAMYKPENALLLFFVCLIATIVCWFITRRWWREAEIAETKSAG